jgi:hypothetical protein
VATTGHELVAQEPVEDARVDAGHVADETQFGVARCGLDQPRVLTADTDCVVAVDVDGGDELRVDLADQHHAGDVDGLGVGDPQAVAELGGLAEPAHQVADLRPAAVHHHRTDADETHQHDVLGEQRERVVVGGSGECVAAVLHHHHLAGEAADVRQGLDQRRDLVFGDFDHGIIPARGSPAVSSRPSATFAAWMAPPDAPLVRLSSADSTTT